MWIKFNLICPEAEIALRAGFYIKYTSDANDDEKHNICGRQ